MAIGKQTSDMVPAEDRQEQETPRYQDLRIDHEHPFDRPVADLLEQEVPVVDVPQDPVGVDDDRLEPVDEADQFEEAEFRLEQQSRW